MTHKIRAKFDAIRSLAFGSVGVNYAAVGAALTVPASVIKIDNLTDADVFISIDGTTNHLIIPQSGFFVFDINTNRTKDDGFFMKIGDIFYAKRVSGAPSFGAVYISVIHE